MNISQSTNLKTKLREVFGDQADWLPKPMSGVAKVGAMKVLNIGIGKAIPFLSRNGFKVLEMKDGYLKAKMPIKGNKNHFGGMYAGALFTVAEVPGGVISTLNFSSDYFPILKNMNMDFKKVARSDVTVVFDMPAKEMKRVETEAAKKGKSDFILKGIVRDKEGDVVAEAVATYQLRAASKLG